jgi:peptidoglycan/LPS O-acetylase OafA/YrhL/lysophospholipase L1-like esterase
LSAGKVNARERSILHDPGWEKSKMGQTNKTNASTYEKSAGISPKLPWVDWIKGIALIWIFINHSVEAIYGGTPLGSPGKGWLQFSDRVIELMPLSGLGLWTLPVNIWRYIGWLGDQGVSLFLVISGFGLTWGLLSKYGEKLPLSQFYKHRFIRLYPMWWILHIAVLVAAYVTGLEGLDMSIRDPNFYLSFIGFRASEGTFYYFSLAWWYIGLAIQLYLVYPFLWVVIRRLGPARFLLLSCSVALIARIVVILIDSNAGMYLSGAVFITRLPEFAFGMCFAVWLMKSRNNVSGFLQSVHMISGSIFVYVCGTFLSLTRAGMVVSPFLVGVGIFCLFYGILSPKVNTTSMVTSALAWVGIHSYSLYLIHFPVIERLVPVNPLWGTLLSVAVTIAGAVTLEKTCGIIVNYLGALFRKYGFRMAALRLALVGVAAYFCAVGAEVTVQVFYPQEVEGWGERQSLAHHNDFGWYLVPDQTTRLRWEGYDYLVASNELGFPGPSYPVEKAPGTIRIVTLGDAFTSAEGVDTGLAWPRLLEADLSSRFPNHKIEVMNFAITGYGPNQYTEVAKAFIPVYRPDLVILNFYLNDFSDALATNAEFQSEIGFGNPPNTGWYSALRLSNTRSLLSETFRNVADTIRKKPDLGKYSGAQFLLLDKQPYEDGVKIVADRLEEIRSLADAVNAEVVMFMVPVPVQVCGPDDVTYFPRGYDLSDATVFDLDKPQRLTEEIAASLEIEIHDLREPFQLAEECPYQPRNLHWTAYGHEVVAGYISETLSADKNRFAPDQ